MTETVKVTLTQESILASNFGKTQQVVGSSKILQDEFFPGSSKNDLRDLARLIVGRI
jgi:hypothetical protein